MLTVKLYRGAFVKVIEAKSVEIFSNDLEGPRRFLSARTPDGSEVFPIINIEPGDQESPIDGFDTAYVENSSGRTIEVVRPIPPAKRLDNRETTCLTSPK